MRYESEFLAHYGIPKMRWGHRRFQNEDGSLTAEGRERYGVGDGDGKSSKASYRVSSKKGSAGGTDKTPEDEKKEKRKAVLKKAAIGLGAAAAIAAVGYGASTKIRNDMRGEAAKLSNRHRNQINTSMDRLQMAKKRANESREKLGKSSDSLKNQANSLRYTMDKAAVKTVAKEIRKHAEMSVKYSKMSVSTTRRQAVANFMKNRGRIVI